MTKISQFIITLVCSLVSTLALANGNTTNDSFSKAKKIMQMQVYTQPDEMFTIYCGAKFDKKKYVILPQGFTSTKYGFSAHSLDKFHVGSLKNRKRYNSVSKCIKPDF